MAWMTRELRTFLLAIALPAVFVAAGGARLLVYSWSRMACEEREALSVRAHVLAEALATLAHEEERLEGRLPPAPPEGFDDGFPRGGQAGRRPPPPRGEERLPPALAESLAELCQVVRRETASLVGGVAFAVRDREGAPLYATGDWPSPPGLVAECPLGPPLGGGTLAVARADGGKAMRTRTVAVVATGATLLFLLVAALVSGGLLFVRTLRRERQALRMKTDFVDNISHELRTPLAGIRLNAELLAEGRIPDAERRRGALASILTEADRLGRMVVELLDFSRLEKGTRRYALESFDLADFASSAAETEGVASISGGRARIAVKGPGARVSADRDALRQICVNLVTNAVKYSEGAIDIEVEGLAIRVMDRGPGVPPGCEARIFERFYRVDDSLARRENGSGLGLFIARALARGMGGDLVYAPRPGGGSVFTLTLAPASDGAPRP